MYGVYGLWWWQAPGAAAGGVVCGVVAEEFYVGSGLN